MKSEKELSRVIKQILAEKTFSTEAMDAIKDLDKEHTALVKAHADLDENYDKLTEKNKSLEDEIGKWVKRESAVNLREVMVSGKEVELAERESKIALKEQKAELTEHFALVGIANVKEVVALVFKNPIVRRSVQSYSSEPIMQNGYQSGTINKTDSKTETEEQE